MGQKRLNKSVKRYIRSEKAQIRRDAMTKKEQESVEVEEELNVLIEFTSRLEDEFYDVCRVEWLDH